MPRERGERCWWPSAWSDQFAHYLETVIGVDADLVVTVLGIIGINIILSGDNAVVIALACRSLPPRQRVIGIILGAVQPWCCASCSR